MVNIEDYEDFSPFEKITKNRPPQTQKRERNTEQENIKNKRRAKQRQKEEAINEQREMLDNGR